MREFFYTITQEDVDENLAIRDILRRRFSFSSRLRNKIKRNKTVYLNNEEVAGWITPKLGDEIKIAIPEEHSNFIPQDIPINPVFEDDDLLLINKPVGYVVHPTKGHFEGTIANGIAYYMEKTNQSFKIRFINRLDMDTSGVLALGKNSHAQDNFIKQVKQGLVEKKYRAIVDGIIEEEEGIIDLPLGFQSPDSPKRCVRADGKPSKTKYRVLERFHKGNGYTYVELVIFTGRTHQIRVHMSHIGHPVVSDPLYGKEQVYLIERQALHAHSLRLKHPVTEEPLYVEAPLPQDMENLLANLRK